MALAVDITQLSTNLAQCVILLAPQLGLKLEPPYQLTILNSNSEYVFSMGNQQRKVQGGRSAFFAYLRLVATCKTLPIVTAPAFESLGFMADCSRNAVLSVSAVKKLICNLAILGYDNLQLYMEDTYQVEGEPYFGYFRGRYSTNELKEIADYGQQFGVQLVPAVQTLAHLSSIFRWRPYWDINDCQDILLVDSERTYKLLDNMIASLRRCVISKQINIGMDEAHFLGLGKYLSEHGQTDRFEIMLRHLRRVIEICNKYDFEPMMWSDMFFRLTAAASYEQGEGSVARQVIDNMPNNVSLIYWNYYERSGSVYDKMIAAHKQFANPLIFAGGAVKWMGFAPDNRYSIDVSSIALKACVKGGVRQVILTAWGDNGAECSVFSVLPTIAYYAAFNEGITSTTDPRFEKLFYAAAGISFNSFMLVDTPNRLTDSKNPAQRNGACKYLLYNDLFMGIMDSTVSGDMPNRFAANASELKAAAKSGGQWSCIFETLGTLCDVVRRKCNLGILTREAYGKGDRNAIILLLAEYRGLERAISNFIEVFRKQWYSENKPHGFDVQEIRLGGLQKRVASCRKRLHKFVKDGTCIPELEEKLLDYFGNQNDFAKPTDCTDTGWHWLASVNSFL